MNISNAVRILKKGYSVRRANWIRECRIELVDSETPQLNLFDGTVLIEPNWPLAISDVLATDWEIVE